MEEYKTFNFIYKFSLLGDFKYRNEYSKIISELSKTGYQYPASIKNKIKSESAKYHFLSSLAFISVIGVTFFTKKVSILNKITLAGIISYFVFYILENKKNKEIVNELGMDDSLIGHECRILIKHFLPNHSKILIINELVDEFKFKRDKIKINEIKIKQNLKEVISKEIIDEANFLKELSERKNKEI